MTAADPAGYLDALRDVARKVSGGDDAPHHAVEGCRPGAVVYPGDLQELAAVLSLAADKGLSVAPWGGGTRVALGNPMRRLDLIVDMSGLDRTFEHNPADLTATVSAGTTVAALQKSLARHGQFVALDPPIPARATLGGTLAIGSGGPLKWQYGNPRDVVIGMAVAQADGKVTRSGGQVVKNVSGYDMSRLHIGGLGTLGIIAEVSLKLTPLPAKQATVVAFFDRLESCHGAAQDIFRGDAAALAMAAFDRRAARLMSAAGADAPHRLAVRLGGRPLTLERQVKEAASACARHGAREVETLDEGEATALWRSLADFGWDEKTEPVLGMRASVVPSSTFRLVQALGGAGGSAEPGPAVVTHPAHGTVLAGWGALAEGLSDAAAAEIASAARSAAEALGGYAVIERASAAVKSRHDVWGDVGGQIAIMRGLKRQYDPRQILNPGRFVGGI